MAFIAVVEKRREVVKELYASTTVQSLAKDLEVSESTIYSDLNALGIAPTAGQRKKRKILTQSERKEVQTRYCAGELTQDLADIFEVSVVTISRCVRDCKRDSKTKKRKDSIYDPVADTYRCRRCKANKPVDEFYGCTSTASGRRYECKDCCREIRAERSRTAEHRQWHAEYERKRRDTKKENILLSNARRRALRKGVPFDLTLDDIEIPNVCPILGIPLVLTNRGRCEDSPTLDRVIPELGYVRGNVVVVSWRANRLKSDATVEEVRAVLKYIEANS